MPLTLQDLDGARVEGDDAASLDGLRLADDDLASTGDEGPTYGQSAGLEVDVTPAQSDRLTSPHARHGNRVPECVEAVVLDCVEERFQLLLRPGLHHLRAVALLARRVGGT